MYELPPILTGSSAQQIAAIRAYLVHMADRLNEAADAPGVTYTQAGGTAAARQIRRGAQSGGTAEADAEAVRRNAAELRALIIKTADGLNGGIEKSASELRSYADGRIEALGERYLARSEFGTFTENIESQISNTARGVVESYGYDARIESNQSGIALLQSYVTDIDGDIRRGLVTDPDTGETVTGIAISQSLQFTGEVTQGEDGMRYYELSSGQTFGLYTSTGWQFWIDGHKRGWYNSVDGMLHIANVAVEDTLQLGGGWRLVNDGGLGIKYTGG